MKILATSCWHIGKTIDGYSMRQDILDASKKVVEATYDVDLAVHLGDMFDTNRPSPRDYADAFGILKEFGCPSVLIPGNHDPDALEPFKYVMFSEEVKVVGVPGVLGIGGKYFMFIGHVRDSDRLDEVRDAGMDAQGWIVDIFERARRAHRDEDVGRDWRVDAVFCHLAVGGARMESGAEMAEDEVHVPINLARKLPCDVIVGHVHVRQRSGNIWMPGSLISTNFADGEQKGFVIVEV